MIKKNCSIQTRRRARGAGLLDVVIGILIFVVGMLALASMQGNLTRSSTDAKVRTVGSNLAEEIVEGMRTFDRLRATATCPATLDGIIAANAFQCVDSVSGTVSRNGVDYAVTVAVDDYFFLPDSVTVTTDTDDLPAGRDTTIADFKYVEIAVNWGGSIPEFITGDNQTSNLGSGSFALSSIIASAPPMGSALIAAEDEDAGTPPVAYIPGNRPDIIRIDVNGSKFKESTTPQPDVIRSQDGLVETWFDVVTYNQGDPTIFIRREEFLVVTCECTLKKATGGALTGLLPTVWNGASYTTGNEGKLVSKTYGVSASNQQSFYCDTCCRDHHDPDKANPGPDEIYDPVVNPRPKWSESGGLDNDHKHYSRGNKGGLVEAGANGNYVEACRMVRKDGFMRVAQDFRQEGFLAFPEGYLDTLAGAEEYSDYVTAAVDGFYAANVDLAPPPSGIGSAIDFPADRVDLAGDPDDTDTTALPLLGLNQQQLRSRGLYIDHQSAELQALLVCVKAEDPLMADPEAWRSCGAPGYTGVLQVLPFFEIQTTWLSPWDSDPQGTPVLVISEPVSDNNTHDRGLAELVDGTAVATVDAWAGIHRGNIGLTATAPITLADTSEPMALVDAHLYIDVGGGGPDVPNNTYSWTGTFSSSDNKVDALGVTITPNGSEFCALSAAGELSCATPNGFNGSIIISGYTKKQGNTWLDLWICPLTQNVAGITVTVENFPGGQNNYAVVSWNAQGDDSTTGGVILTIENSACGL